MFGAEPEGSPGPPVQAVQRCDKWLVRRVPRRCGVGSVGIGALTWKSMVWHVAVTLTLTFVLHASRLFSPLRAACRPRLPHVEQRCIQSHRIRSTRTLRPENNPTRESAPAGRFSFNAKSHVSQSLPFLFYTSELN